MNWLISFSDEEPEQTPGNFSLDGRASLQRIVGHITEQTNADVIGPWIAVFEDDGR